MNTKVRVLHQVPPRIALQGGQTELRQLLGLQRCNQHLGIAWYLQSTPRLSGVFLGRARTAGGSHSAQPTSGRSAWKRTLHTYGVSRLSRFSFCGISCTSGRGAGLLRLSCRHNAQ